MTTERYENPFEKEPCASCRSRWIDVMDGGVYYCNVYKYDIEKCKRYANYAEKEQAESTTQEIEVGGQAMKKTAEVVKIEFPAGSTPMTVAEIVYREVCRDTEWIEEVIYWLNCALRLAQEGDK